MYSTLKSCACLKMTFKLLGDSSQSPPRTHTHIHCFSYLTIECLVHCIRVPHGIPQHASITLSHFTYLFPCDSLLGSSNALLPSMPPHLTCCPAPPGHAERRQAESWGIHSFTGAVLPGVCLPSCSVWGFPSSASLLSYAFPYPFHINGIIEYSLSTPLC